MAKLKKLIHFLYGLYAATGSLRGYLNLHELLRVVSAAVTAGGGVLGILSAVAADASGIFAGPYVAIASAVIAAIVQVVRFLHQGDPIPPSGIAPAPRPTVKTLGD